MRILGKIIKFLGNFIGVILSLVLSVALLGMLIATPMLSGVSALTRPETISQVVREIDFAQFFMDSFRGELSDEEKIELEFVVELTQTNAFDDLVDLYAIDISNAFEETQKPSVLTKEALRKIVKDNMDEVLQIIRKIGEDEGDEIKTYTDAELEEKVWEAFDELADRFLEMAPTVEDLRSLMGKVADKITGSSSEGEERPNSGMEFVENDTPSYDNKDEVVNENPNGGGGGTITYMPQGDGNNITTIIVGPDGTIQSGGDGYIYYVDPETGEIVFKGGEGGLTASGGTISFGKAVAIQNSKIRVLLMGIGPSGGVQEDTGAEQDEIVDMAFKLARMAKNGTLTLLFVGVIAVLVLLLCLLRWPRFKGFMWAAVVLLIGAVLVAAAGFAFTVMPGMMAGSAGAEIKILSAVDPVIRIIANSMYVAAGIYAGVAIVLIVLFVIFRKALRKQKAAKAAAIAQAEAIEMVANEAEAVAAQAPAVICEEEPAAEAVSADAEEIPAEEAEIPVEDVEIPAEEVEAPAEEAEIPAQNEEEPAEEEIPAE